MAWGSVTSRLLPAAIRPWLVCGVGVSVLGVLSLILFWDGQVSVPELQQSLLPIVFALAIVAVGVLIRQSDLGEGTVTRIMGWTVGGVTSMVALGTWYFAIPTLFGSFNVGISFLTTISAGAFLGIVIGYYDSNVRRLTERASRQKARQEHLQEQQETLAVLNGILRHHLLNDLTVIRGHAEVIHDRDDHGQFERSSEVVLSRCDEMTATVEQIRTIAETITTEPDLQPIDLSSTVRNVLDDVQPNYDARISYHGPGSGLDVEADELLEVAISSLVTNAIVHNDAPNPRVHVRVEPPAEDSTVATLEIADNGPGIPDDVRETMFEPNTRGAESTGDGLGLFLTCSVVDRYGGEITVTDNDPRGTVVSVALPGAAVERRVEESVTASASLVDGAR
jgi:signal transduction histidine kinase